MSDIVRWTDHFGEEHVLMEGKGDDVFHAIPNRRDEDGSSYVEILSKKAIIDMADLMRTS